MVQKAWIFLQESNIKMKMYQQFDIDSVSPSSSIMKNETPRQVSF